MQMPYFQVFFLALCALNRISTVATTPSTPTDLFNTSHVDDVFSDKILGLGIPPWPVGFNVSYDFELPKIKRLATLMTAVEALKQMALEDWTGVIASTQSFGLPDYQAETVIDVIPYSQGQQLERRFAIWGVILGLFQMWKNNKECKYLKVTLEWQEVPFGLVVFNTGAVTTPLSISGKSFNGSLNVDKRSAANDSAILQMVNNTASVEATVESHLKTIFSAAGGEGGILDIFDVFFPIMSALSELASLPKSFRLDHFVTGLKGFDGALCIRSVYRTSPPYLEVQWIIVALSRLPAYMLSVRRWGSVHIILGIDEQLIGVGGFLKMEDPQCGGL
ncbi:MAG: hypothetical protein ALECFALPRED_010284 [Alectoria fallacina]|uniref:Uncharacterized protein n=1 Tax=Alectoria fallacina TaxID=1903189 RepID=A0A8H3J959_9LECA|nr:MAG: hypothetical protein ALECFALPRED_010284 [Alectoria fallacina]